jgi:hypothetical protein
MSSKGLLPSYEGPLILGDLKTDNLLLINVLYHYATAESGWHDSCDVILKNVDTNDKILLQIEDPKMVMYVVIMYVKYMLLQKKIYHLSMFVIQLIFVLNHMVIQLPLYQKINFYVCMEKMMIIT